MKLDVRAGQFGRHFSTTDEEGPALTVQQRRERRAGLFAETPLARARRLAATFVSAVKLFRLNGFLTALGLVWRGPAMAVAGLPDPEAALQHPPGLCGLVADATPEGLLEGLARGLAPAACFGPLSWWSPRHRMVAEPGDFREPEQALALMRDNRVKITLDRDFDAVLAACGRPALLAPGHLHLFAALHDMGFAHAVEVRSPFGRLVGGAWGVALGRVFVTLGAFGEPGVREVALTALNRHLLRMKFALHDLVCDETAERLGFSAWSRASYFNELLANSGMGRLGRWQAVPALLVAEPAPTDLVAMQRAA